jgi:hypothetical protein
VLAALGRARRAVWERAGHRGLFLLTLGVYDLFYGAYLIAGGPVVARLLLPSVTWGWGWVACGTLLLAGGLMDRDGWAFAVATAVKVAWALEFARLALLGVPGQGWRSGYFLALALVVICTSAWPEARR